MKQLEDPNNYETFTRFRENYALSNAYTLGTESCESIEHLEQFRTFGTLRISWFSNWSNWSQNWESRVAPFDQESKIVSGDSFSAQWKHFEKKYFFGRIVPEMF